jgi:hypothetical protein
MKVKSETRRGAFSSPAIGHARSDLSPRMKTASSGQRNSDGMMRLAITTEIWTCVSGPEMQPFEQMCTKGD